MRELAHVNISTAHLRRLASRFGREWADARDADVQAFRDDNLATQYAKPPDVATVMVDGGKVQVRDESGGNGVSDPAWEEVKVACCQSMSSKVHATDPQPDPPKKFLDPVRAARLAAEMKARGGAPKGRAGKEPGEPKKAKAKKAKAGKRNNPQKVARTVIASMCNSDEFGWHVAAEVQRRNLGEASRKGYICDGQKYNWTLYEMHLRPQGFVAILDFLHLLSYLYGAAGAVEGRGTAQAWQRYERWLRLAWGGHVQQLLAGLSEGCARLGPPPDGCADEDPRKVAAEALGYVTNNRERMAYPRYRRLGLPISSAAVERVMKQVNRRMKATDKFWREGGAEAIVQIRAAYLSEDDRADRYWARPRPYSQAVGGGRLRPQA